MSKNANANSNSVSSVYTKTYTSFSGADMVAIIDVNIPNKEGSYNKVTKVLGEMMTISYSIHMDKKPVRSLGSVNAKDYVFGPRTIAGSLIFAQFNRHIAQDILAEAEKTVENKHSQMIVMDEMPPFNITISMANEYGSKARLAIYGIRIVNEGNVISVNDVYTENTYQFVATDIEYLTDSTSTSSDSDPITTQRAKFDSKMISMITEDGAPPIPELPDAFYTEDDIYVDIDEEEGSIGVTDGETGSGGGSSGAGDITLETT